MALDQVRQASKVLGPLLRRRGTSPALGVALRRGLQALDKALSGLSEQAQDDTVAAAIAELQGCAELIRKSDRPADHEQLAGIEKALALLAPAEVAIPAAPAPEPTPVKERARLQAEPSSVRARARAAVPVADIETAGVLLDGYQAEIEAIEGVLGELLCTAADLDAASAALCRRIESLKWLGKDRIPEILRVADHANSLVDRLAAGAALVHLGDTRGAEMMIGLLGKAAAEKQPLPEATAILLRTIADDSLSPWLLQVFNLPVHPAVGAMLLPVLVEHSLLPADELWHLVGHGKDELAVEAARALPWVDGQFDPQTLVAWAEQSRTPRRTNALLFAAAVLGSAQALARIRARLQAAGQEPDGIDPLMIDALAVAGDASDARLLARLAGQIEEHAPALLLAAAGLGWQETLTSLPELEEQVSVQVLAEVRRMIAGDGERVPARNELRMLRGRPWSVSGVLARLEAPDETLRSRQRMTLELRARTGQAPASAWPWLSPASARPGLLADWNSQYAKADSKLEPGHWYCQGKPVSLAATGSAQGAAHDR